MNNWLRSIPFTYYHGNAQNDKAITSGSFSYGVDEVAAFNAFVQHWQQIKEIFNLTKAKEKVSCDDVTIVVNNFGQMINLLLVDLREITKKPLPEGNQVPSAADSNGLTHKIEAESRTSLHTPIFDHFLGERVLQIVFQWSVFSGEFLSVMQLELLKVYETLLSNSHPEILIYKPITEPLLDLLDSCSGCIPVEVERRLVVLLNQLWVSLMHDQQFLKYFFLYKENDTPRFQIFSLLLPFIHREGSIGQQARDALLLSMTLSAKHCGVADYIFQHSNFCPVLAAGLSGLYSMLPRSLNIRTDGWYRISADDVASIPPLQMFINSLEFCNAIVQISHPVVQKQLVDYLYHGFLVPVVGRALIQNVLGEVVAAIVYMEFLLQTVTEEKLRRAFLALLLVPQEYSELPLLTSLISHLHSSNVQLTLVTLNLFNTLILLHSEDAMIALVFQYLTPCDHVMLSQRSKLSKLPFAAAERFLLLLPSICQVSSSSGAQHQRHTKNSFTSVSDSVRSPSFSVYLEEAKRKVASAYHACSSWAWSYNSQSPLPTEATHLIAAAKLLPVIPYAKVRAHSDPTSQSLPYEKIEVSPGAKQRSSSLPDYSRKPVSVPCLPKMKQEETSVRVATKAPNLPSSQECNHKGNSSFSNTTEEEVRLSSLGGSSGYESFNPRGSRDSSPLHKGSPGSDTPKGPFSSSPHGSDRWTENDDTFFHFLDHSKVTTMSSSQEEDDLQFIDDFYQAVRESPSSKKAARHCEDPESELPPLWLTPSLSSAEEESSADSKDLLLSHPKPTIGPFLEALISQVDNIFVSNTDASLLAMTCLTNLASYPCPLLTSLLLQPSVVLQPAVRSLYQVLGQLKQRIDSVILPKDFPIVSDARQKIYHTLSAELALKEQTEVVATASPFIRGGEKRRSFTQTMSSLFKRSQTGERTPRREGLMNLPDGSGYRYINTPVPHSHFLEAPTEKRQAAICCLLLEEWLHELAALAEEHTVFAAFFRFCSLPTSS